MRTRRAFSLLEIILALAILAGAVAVLGQLNRNGMESARLARDLTQAQLRCESKLAEIAAGLEAPESKQETSFDDEDDSTARGWLYSVEVNSAGQAGVLEVRVTVRQDPDVFSRPVQYTLVRWMLDPESVESTEEDDS
jgi:type II secretion system protein I